MSHAEPGQQQTNIFFLFRVAMCVICKLIKRWWWRRRRNEWRKESWANVYDCSPLKRTTTTTSIRTLIFFCCCSTRSFQFFFSFVSLLPFPVSNPNNIQTSRRASTKKKISYSECLMIEFAFQMKQDTKTFFPSFSFLFVSQPTWKKSVDEKQVVC